MESYQLVKAFVASAKEYSIQKTEITINNLQRYLQILSATNDLSIFDTGSCEAAEFYVTLHELMAGLDAHSELMWCAVSVLQEAARNPNTRIALIHTYKFTAILSRLLSNQLIPEKLFRVLKLLEELTYGVKISWQEGHLPSLIKLLVSYIENSELISVALGVLVNICYKNIPAVYTLMQCVDTKAMIRSILRTTGDNVRIRVQLCKLMMILDHMADIPDAEMVNFVKVTYTMMEQALKSNNVHLLRHIVDFFKDMKNNPHAKQAVSTYPSYYTNTEALLDLLSEEDDQQKSECMSLFMEFLQFLLLMEVADLNKLYSRIVKFALGWIQVENSSVKAFDLLYTASVQCRTKDSSTEIYHSVMELLAEQLQTLLLMLETGSDVKTPASNELYTAMTSLLHLLQELTYNSTLCAQIEAAVTKSTIQKLFHPLLSADQSKSNNVYEQPILALYVQALCFLAELAQKNTEWLLLYSDLLRQKQLLRALAISLYSGSLEVKQQVLFLTGSYGFPKDSVATLAECLLDLNQMLVLAPSNNSQIVPSVSSVPPHEGMTFFTLTQKAAIDNFISKLEHQFEKKQVQDISASTVIELYQYKLSAMSHAEKAMQNSLEAATSYSTHLTHRIAQMSAELGRLHQLLYSNQLLIEGGKLELSNAKVLLQETQKTANTSYSKYKQLKQDLVSKTRIITEMTEATENFKKKTEILEKHCNEIEGQIISYQTQVRDQENAIQSLKTELAEKTQVCEKLEEKLAKREKTIIAREAEIEKRIVVNQGLEREVANQRALVKGLERTTKDKEIELQEAQKKITELQKVRDAIYEISAGKR